MNAESIDMSGIGSDTPAISSNSVLAEYDAFVQNSLNLLPVTEVFQNVFPKIPKVMPPDTVLVQKLFTTNYATNLYWNSQTPLLNAKMLNAPNANLYDLLAYASQRLLRNIVDMPSFVQSVKAQLGRDVNRQANGANTKFFVADKEIIANANAGMTADKFNSTIIQMGSPWVTLNLLNMIDLMFLQQLTQLLNDLLFKPLLKIGDNNNLQLFPKSDSRTEVRNVMLNSQTSIFTITFKQDIYDDMEPWGHLEFVLTADLQTLSYTLNAVINPIANVTLAPAVNESLLNTYIQFVNENPTLLPMTETFQTIQQVWRTVNPINYLELTRDQKDEIRNELMPQFFRLNAQYNNYMLYAKSDETFRPITVIVNNKSDKNLYAFLARMLYIVQLSSLTSGTNHSDSNYIFNYKTNALSLTYLKNLVGNDALRREVYANNVKVNVKHELPDNTDSSDKYMIADSFNKAFLKTMQSGFDLNKLSMVDISFLQQVETQIQDTFLNPIFGIGYMYERLASITNVTSSTIKVKTKGVLTQLGSETKFAKYLFNTVLTQNMVNLTYAYQVSVEQLTDGFPTEIDITAKFEDKNALASMLNNDTSSDDNGSSYMQYASSHSKEIAAGLGATAVLGTGALLLAGILGGSKKRKKRKKRTNNKSKKRQRHKTQKNKRGKICRLSRRR